MPRYIVSVREETYRYGTIEVTAEGENDALQTALDQVLDDYDAVDWGDAERDTIDTTSASLLLADEEDQ